MCVFLIIPRLICKKAIFTIQINLVVVIVVVVVLPLLILISSLDGLLASTCIRNELQYSGSS